MKMKKIWAILLAAIMLVSCFPALSEEPDESEGVRTNVQLIRGVDIQEELKVDPEGTAEGYLYTLADDSGTILQSLDFKSITVKTGSIHVIVNEKTYISMEAGTSLSYADNAITLKGGTATVSTGETESDDRLILADNIKVLLNQVNIKATNGPAIQIQSTASAAIWLQEGTTNTISAGGGDYAGLEVGWNSGSDFGSLVIDGNGELNATGAGRGAGIGGSYSHQGVYGNITINGGIITANGAGNSAGIGSSDNPKNGTSHGSYKHTSEGWGTITINGGSITAKGNKNGAGIGGGNHTDSGEIIINNGTINASGESGIGSGLGSSKGADKGPGYYCAYITINGGDITAYATNNMGAGIGGGEYSDAYVTITGGTINASVNTGGNEYQSGAGIGGGYQGLAVVNITGGTIIATGGQAGPGIGNGALGTFHVDGSSGKDVRVGVVSVKRGESRVNISNGNIQAYGGAHGAGIGSGNATEESHVVITGGSVFAKGGESDSTKMEGAAGIGSGSYSVSSKSGYCKNTDVSVSISGGTVVATGGWGAAGIGSGASNVMAESISITGGNIQAYADGTKFAIDTRILNSDGSTTSKTEGRNISVPVLQGTFVHSYTLEGGIKQNPEGLNSIVLKNDSTGKKARELTGMPAGYRSFAATVPSDGVYNVYTDSASIGQGGGRYFAEALKDVYNKNELADIIQYTVAGSSLSDNFYLYPVKTFVVEKKMASETEGDSLSDINTTAYFNLVADATQEVKETAGIRITNGVPEGRAYFVNVPDDDYEIWEVDGNGKNPVGQKFGTHILTKITTADSSEGESNDGSISPDKWTDTVAVINTYGSNIIDIDVTKVWSDSDNQDGIRPDSVTIQLLANGADVADRTMTLSAANNWTDTFTGLERQDDEGKEIVYTIRENTIAGYTAAITGTAADGFTVTNTHVPAATEITVTKDWIDSDNQDGIQPESVTVRLLADGKETQNASLSAENNWNHTFTGLPVNNAGKAIAYTITEDAVTGYTTEITGTAAAGFIVTNTHVPATTEVAVTKVWNDNNDQDGIRPANVTIRLLADGTEVRNAVLTGGESSWSHTFTDLPRNSHGRAIAYTVTEDTVTGYTTTITGTAATGFTVTNTHTPDTTEVKVTKVWNDNSNQDGVRPENVTIRLLANGTEVRSAEITGTGDSWSYTFTDLPRNSGGRAITYTIAEDTVTGYTNAITGTAADGFTVTNTHTPDTTEVTVTKAWSDNGNQDGVRPENVTIRLLANGTEVRSAEITGTGDSWSYTFTDLPRNSAGRAITYSITEDAVTGYTTAITGTAADGFTVTNTHEPAAIQVTVAKVWNDNNNQDGIRPAAVTVNLMANGTQVRTQRVIGNGNRWTYTFTDLPQFENGTEIVYTVNENAVTGYTAAITGTAAAGFTLTNTHAPEVISVSGRKTWADQNNTDGIRPASITVHLLADGRQTETRTVTDDTYMFENLPRFINGREIVYSISEDPVEGYTTEINGYDLTNRHTPLRISVNGAKVWGDHENRDGLRPQAITVHLLADGQEVGTQRVTGTGDRWTYSFANLPAYADGKLIRYTVTEDAVEGYETTVVGHEIYNVHRNEDPDADPELYTLTVRYWADGQKAFPDFRGTYEFGAMYNVVSPEKPGYTVDLEVAAGIIVEDTVIDVYYTPRPVTLTIYYQYMDGSIAADTYFVTLMPGDPYDVVSTVIEDFTATQLRVEGIMPNRNAEFVVWYLPETEPDPETGRTRIPGGYTKIDDYGVPLGLGNVNRNAGECVE